MARKTLKSPAPADLTVDVVGLEQDILAVSKPVGMNTIQQVGWVNGLPRLYDVVCSEFPQARFLNRIDRDTSGIVLFGMTKAARSHLSKIWHPHKDEGVKGNRRKIYLCVAETPDWDFVQNDNPLKDPKSPRMLPASTSFRVLETKHGLSLIEAELVSHGRTHQIRRHLAEMGYPILGDYVYGGIRSKMRNGQMLHAWKNVILGPDGSMITFQSVVPDDMGGFTVDGGTCLQKIPVTPLTRAEMEAEYEWSRRPRMDLDRMDGESFQDFQTRKRGLMIARDEAAEQYAKDWTDAHLTELTRLGQEMEAVSTLAAYVN